ncbi:hypothetical protein BX616_003395 [Lobosporangium transversale]|nr:hypothetical protein BX616_003395 [Lobosporangium transversale]
MAQRCIVPAMVNSIALLKAAGEIKELAVGASGPIVKRALQTYALNKIPPNHPFLNAEMLANESDGLLQHLLSIIRSPTVYVDIQGVFFFIVFPKAESLE